MKIDFTYYYPIYGAENSFINIFTIILLLLGVVFFIKNRFDVLNPSFIYSICLTGCCALAALYTKIWNLPMHFNTGCIILLMSLSFFIGGELAEYCSCKYGIEREVARPQIFLINQSVWIFFSVLLLVLAYLSYTEFLHVAQQVTEETELFGMLKPVINGLSHKEISMSRWNAYRFRFSTGMAYLSVLAFWINLTAHQYKEALKWSSFVILYIPFMVLTGGRQQFMYLIIFAMISFFLVKRKTNQGKKSVGKEVAIIGVAVGVFLFCFLGIGLLNGKIGGDTSFLRVLVHYAGINISAFDVYINEMAMPDTQYIGTTTLDPIYIFLNNHGFNVPRFYQYITLFTAFGPVTTNVYTAFYRYIHDFGYFGCALIMFLLGFFYSFMYRQMYRDGLKNWMILIYASIAYPVFLMGREERFFNEILTTSKASFIVEVLLLYKVFVFLSERERKQNEFTSNH